MIHNRKTCHTNVQYMYCNKKNCDLTFRVPSRDSHQHGCHLLQNFLFYRSQKYEFLHMCTVLYMGLLSVPILFLLVYIFHILNLHGSLSFHRFSGKFFSSISLVPHTTLSSWDCLSSFGRRNSICYSSLGVSPFPHNRGNKRRLILSKSTIQP